MTKLPAIRDAIDALAHAQKMIVRGHDGSSFFESPKSREFVRNIAEAMLLTTEGQSQLLAYARAGEKYSQEIALAKIAEMRNRGAELPRLFEAYEIDLLEGMIPPPVTVPGPDQRNTLLRDIAIAATVAAVCDRYNLKPTGRSGRKRSGCAIVAEALGVINRRMSTDAVEKIYKRFKHGMPTVKGWTLSLENQ